MLKNTFYIFRYNNFIKSKITAVLIGAIVGVVIFFPHLCRNTYKVTVTNKQIVKRNNINEYLIYAQAENGTIKVFEDVNNFLELKFNSEDLYLSMEINRKYEVKAYGLGIPALSHYENIIKVKGIDKGSIFSK